MKITIEGNPITKKNSMQIVRFGNRPAIIPSKQYKAYEKEFIAQCMEQGFWNKGLNDEYNIGCKYYMKTRRRVDLTNLLSATMDCLVAAKVIEDDNCKIAVSHDGSRVYYDKEHPRVEIELKGVE